ncbi:YbaB/EbfC family nucleoid-associated protein [Desulfurivibrio dismutans]|uniref:YbaB/EbfC family nucleoid-associated protein n=1 Tax=Desulfurivibrio dismutans TaxID=1398908 RepID=UPI0023DAB724|nr:YbaB/EbfC family nucleoid-associated protein [Desulfurivibrio alkaliphilus]MDF1613665.1 YbaB/EbfC family nucleoid-associated protein [Desulfurivibrio alkaliphilus]
MDMQQIMQQAQQFQQKMAGLQAELAERTVTSSVGGGMVQVTVNGRHQLVELKIEPAVINPEDPEMLRDLVVAAVNDAMAKAQEMIQAEMGKLTGGMNIPGLF